MHRVDTSIIVPMYNAAKTITACVEAIIHSTPNHVEIVVVDDCSTDDSAAHVPSHPRLTVLSHSQNKGPSAARNTGARHASGKSLSLSIQILWFVQMPYPV